MGRAGGRGGCFLVAVGAAGAWTFQRRRHGSTGQRRTASLSRVGQLSTAGTSNTVLTPSRAGDRRPLRRRRLLPSRRRRPRSPAAPAAPAARGSRGRPAARPPAPAPGRGCRAMAAAPGRRLPARRRRRPPADLRVGWRAGGGREAAAATVRRRPIRAPAEQGSDAARHSGPIEQQPTWPIAPAVAADQSGDGGGAPPTLSPPPTSHAR